MTYEWVPGDLVRYNITAPSLAVVLSDPYDTLCTNLVTLLWLAGPTGVVTPGEIRTQSTDFLFNETR